MLRWLKTKFIWRHVVPKERGIGAPAAVTQAKINLPWTPIRESTRDCHLAAEPLEAAHSGEETPGRMFLDGLASCPSSLLRQQPAPRKELSPGGPRGVPAQRAQGSEHPPRAAKETPCGPDPEPAAGTSPEGGSEGAPCPGTGGDTDARRHGTKAAQLSE